MTREERAREKRLGYMKHHLSEHDSRKDIEVKIIWSKRMVVTRDGQGKERKVVLYHLGSILLQVNMGLIEQVTQDELQGREEQGR